MFYSVFGLILFAFVMEAASQEKYPNRPIELVIPFAAGGVADVAARIYSDDLSRALNVQVMVVARGGGAGIEGTTYVARAKKDGYTLLHAGGTPMVITPIMNKEATYDPLKDFVPLGYFCNYPGAFTVRSDSPFQTLNELIEYARKNPGKLKNACGGGLGSLGYFNISLLGAKNNIKITTIPFASGGETLPNILGGHVDMTSDSLTTVGPQIKAGKLRGLAITTKARHPDYPNIPTTAELGHPYINLNSWYGVFAPVGVPQQVVNVLVPALEKVFKNPEVAQRGAKVSLTVEYMGPEELRKFMESEIRTAEKVARDVGLSIK